MRLRKFIIPIFLIGIVGGMIFKLTSLISDENFENQLPAVNHDSFDIARPPRDSITGQLVNWQGKVLWQGRVATQPAQLTGNDKIQQGETLLTKGDSSATIRFPDQATINLQPQTEIEFVQLLPSNFVFNQVAGTANYTTSSQTAWSVRSLHLLAKMETGEMVFTVDKELGKIMIDVKSGSVTVGFNDLDNRSTVYKIKTGQRFIFIDDIRQGQIQ